MPEEYVQARRRRSRNENGQAALFMTMTIGVTLGVMGLVVDEGWAYWRQEACLTAAQAAAIAAAQYANSNNATWPPSSCTSSSPISCNATGATCPTNLTLATNATSVLTAACLYAQQNGFKATGNQNITVYTNTGNPPNVSGVASAYYINVRVAEKTPLTFLAALAGNTSAIVSGSSTAIVAVTATSDCIYVLDPSGSAAVNANNGISVQSECGYWINSSSSSALTVIGGASIKALNSSSINLVGGTSINNGGSVSPTPTVSGAATDPFLSRSVPLQRSVTGSHTYSCSYGSTGGCAHTSTASYQCDYTNFVANAGGSNVSMSPGVYCGTGGSPAISIGNVNTVTFASGVYILDGGGMNLGGIGGINSVTATAGVCFFNTGTNSTYKYIVIGNGVPFTASANTSGSQAGIVFYQDPSLSPGINANTTSQFQGGSNLSIAGSIYLPTTAMLFANGTNTSNLSTALVVYDVTFTGGAYFKKDAANITSLGATNKSFLVQ
jgi:hypothetical protein